MLHFKYGVLAEIHEALHLLLVPAVADGCVEECFLGFLDLWFLPLIKFIFIYLKINSFNLIKLNNVNLFWSSSSELNPIALVIVSSWLGSFLFIVRNSLNSSCFCCLHIRWHHALEQEIHRKIVPFESKTVDIYFPNDFFF